MRRTKKWWKALNGNERKLIVYIEHNHAFNDRYIPDDCSYCRGCDEPTLGSLCPVCSNIYHNAINKANEAVFIEEYLQELQNR
jgi:hypothetical protein